MTKGERPASDSNSGQQREQRAAMPTDGDEPETGDIAERLRAVRLALGLSQVEMAARCQIPLDTWKKYEGDKRAPRSTALVGIARAGVDLHWLLTGEGQMQRDGASRLPDAVADSGYVPVPYSNMRAAAGVTDLADREEVVDFFLFKRDWIEHELAVEPAELYLVRVAGESMEPTLAPGDTVLVDCHECHAIPNDGIYLMRLAGTLLIKRVQRLPGGRVRVISDNSAYKPYELELDTPDPEWLVIGRVVWIGHRV